jgi:hypothetical protein
MELLLIAIYSAICVAVFKIFRIPVNKWTLPTAALGGKVKYVLDAIATGQLQATGALQGYGREHTGRPRCCLNRC